LDLQQGESLDIIDCAAVEGPAAPPFEKSAPDEIGAVVTDLRHLHAETLFEECSD
jgi:hypothetical protein